MAARTSAALIKALENDAGSYRWVAATDGSQYAATLELASGGEPVMAIGGFNNEGGHLSLAQFEQYVKAGDIHYYIASGGGTARAAASVALSRARHAGGGGFRGGAPTGGASTSSKGIVSSLFDGNAGSAPGDGYSTSAITTWVEAHFHKQTIGGETVYNLTERS